MKITLNLWTVVHHSGKLYLARRNNDKSVSNSGATRDIPMLFATKEYADMFTSGQSPTVLEDWASVPVVVIVGGDSEVTAPTGQKEGGK